MGKLVLSNDVSGGNGVGRDRLRACVNLRQDWDHDEAIFTEITREGSSDRKGMIYDVLPHMFSANVGMATSSY